MADSIAGCSVYVSFVSLSLWERVRVRVLRQAKEPLLFFSICEPAKGEVDSDSFRTMPSPQPSPKGRGSQATKLYKRKIKLFLKDKRVAVDVDVAEIIFDLVEHVAFGTAQSFRYFRIDSQHRLARSFGFS